jgi:hypothetical protein
VTAPASPWFDFSSTEAGVRYQCLLEGETPAADWAACAPGRTFTFTKDGSRTLTIRAIDRAGQVSPLSAPVTFQVDGTIPTVTVAAPVADLRTKDTAQTFRFKASEADVTYGCRIDGDRFQSCAGPADADGRLSRAYTGLSHGTHVFGVRARDRNGNVGPVTEHRVHVDLRGPEIVVTAPAEGETTGIDSAVQFAATPESSLGDERHTFECSVNGGAWEACGTGHALRGLPGGVAEVKVRGTDDLGNVGPVAVRRFKVDATGPVIAFDAPTPGAGARVSSSPIFVWHADEEVKAYRCWLDGTELANCGSPRGIAGVALGAHTFAVQGTDMYGNTGARLERSFEVVRVATAPPVLVLDPRTGNQVALESLTLDRNVQLAGLLAQGLPLQIEANPGATVVRLRIFRVQPVGVHPARPVNVGRNGNRRQQRKPGLAAAAAKRTRKVLVSTTFAATPKQAGAFEVRLRGRSVSRLRPGRYLIEMRSGTTRTKLSGKTVTRTFEVRR